MMKKLLLLASLCIFSFAAKTQVSTITPVTDTLHYYFNKEHFKTNKNVGQFPYYKAAAATVTNVTHCGSKFVNNDTLLINGLEAFACRNPSSSQLKIKVHLYLCSLNSSGLPVLPAIDSVICEVGGPATPSLLGGNFVNGPRKLTTDFAVLFRNMSTIAGDTVRLTRTSSKTYTAWAPSNGPTWAEKYSDGFGFVRFNAKFYSTTNFTIAPGFGYGTDYEFCVAPRVSYTLVVGEQWPTKVVNSETLCTHEQVKFKNVSSPQLTNRMFNLNEFYRKWNLLSPLAVPTNTFWSPDTTVTWVFEPEFYQSRERLFLNYGGNPNEITFYTDSASETCFTANKFKACHRPMRIYGNAPQLNFVEDFTLCVNFCTDDAVGLSINQSNPVARLFPNPTVSGKSNIVGLVGHNTISVYNILGEIVYSEATDKEKVQLDLSDKPNGNYLVRITSDTGRSQIVKIIKQN